jgi:hypothetical protein
MLRLDRDMNWFEGKRRRGALHYDVMLTCRDPDDPRAVAKAVAQAEAAVPGLERSLSAIREAISDQLLDKYNDAWREEGRPLSATAFQRKLELESVEISPTRVTLMFDCAGLFSDHAIEVRLSPRLEVREVCLAG